MSILLQGSLLTTSLPFPRLVANDTLYARISTRSVKGRNCRQHAKLQWQQAYQPWMALGVSSDHHRSIHHDRSVPDNAWAAEDDGGSMAAGCKSSCRGCMSQQHSQLLLGECGVQGQALLGLRLVGHGRQEGHPEDIDHIAVEDTL